MRVLTFALIAALAMPAAAVAQDSGPGPIDSAAARVYDTSVFQRFSETEASFSFAADFQEEPDKSKSGSFEVTLGENVLSGTWSAYDLGDYAIWYGRAESDTQDMTAFGWSTPEVIIGRTSIRSTTKTNARRGLLSLLRRFGFGGRQAYFYGEAVVEEPPPEEETPETPSAPVAE
jgi:hypothetical protein